MEYEKFPHMGLIKTYNVDMMTPDSASAATAMLSGVKTRSQTLGVDGEVKKNDCASMKGHEVDTILDWALAAGKSVGIVTTTDVVSPTPAAAYAHAASRSWTTDSKMLHKGVDPRDGCRAIAYQLIVGNPNIQVILGGGRNAFTEQDPLNILPHDFFTTFLYRSDGLNLIQMWKDDKQRRGVPAEYVTNTGELTAVDADTTDYLLGLFSPAAMSYDIDRNTMADGEPSLAEMTEKAIEILSKNPNGYFLFVEGGRVDHAHHFNLAKRALYDVLSFEDAVKRASALTNQKDRGLIVVTSDHGHTMTIGGNAPRGNNILGKVVENELNDNDMLRTADGKPMTVLVYGTGNSYNMSSGRPDITNISTADDVDYQYQIAVPMMMGGVHSTHDVPVFANGPMSHLFFGVQEQNYIAHALAYASCLGKHREHCVLSAPSCGTRILNTYAIVTVIAMLLFTLLENGPFQFYLCPAHH